jgi:hypothetical protein
MDADYIFRNLKNKVKINETFRDGFTFFCKTHHEKQNAYLAIFQVFSAKAIRMGFGFKLS